jgi:hypothetical protein
MCGGRPLYSSIIASASKMSAAARAATTLGVPLKSGSAGAAET